MNTFRLGILAAVWLGVVGTGMVLMAAYKGTPGAAAPSPVRWPADSTLERDQARPTLVVFLHPRCPCSRASLGELEILMTQLHGRVEAQVAFIQPAGTPDDWVESDLWTKAAHLPGVTVSRDRGGVEAARFHVRTSGEALLYAAGGELLYEGGITIARGHAGDNPGRSAIAALVNGEAANASRGPVFGCPMFAQETQSGEPVCKK